REQLFAILVAGERAWLAHERPDDVAIVDAGRVLAAQPRHRLDQLAAIEHLDRVRMLADLDLVADQPRGHRVCAVRDPDGAPTPDARVVGRVARDRRRRQRSELFALYSKIGSTGA